MYLCVLMYVSALMYVSVLMYASVSMYMNTCINIAYKRVIRFDVDDLGDRSYVQLSSNTWNDTLSDT